MSDRPPAFQFYAKDFYTDLNVIKMSAEEVGGYILLIALCWVEDGLPNNIEDLALIAKIPLNRFKKSWEKVLAQCFVLDNKKNKFFHPRLLKEIKKQKDFRKKKSDAGKESGRKRRERKRLDAEQVFDSVQTNDEHNTNTTRTKTNSSSSSSTTLEEKKKQQENPASASAQTDLLESQDDYLIRKQVEYPQIDIPELYKKYCRHCLSNNQKPARPIFDVWCAKELPPMIIPPDVLNFATEVYTNPMTGKGFE